MKIVVEPSRFVFRENRAVVGEIWFQHGDKGFPGVGWTDFVVVILSWWFEACSHLKPRKSQDLLFMEGPYEVRARMPRTGIILLTLRERDSKIIVHGSVEVSEEEFLQELVRAARIVLVACEENGKLDADTASLRAGIAWAESLVVGSTGGVECRVRPQ